MADIHSPRTERSGPLGIDPTICNLSLTSRADTLLLPLSLSALDHAPAQPSFPPSSSHILGSITHTRQFPRRAFWFPSVLNVTREQRR